MPPPALLPTIRRDRGGRRAAATAARGRPRYLNEIAFTASVILWTIRSASSVPCFPFRDWPFRRASAFRANQKSPISTERETIVEQLALGKHAEETYAEEHNGQSEE